MLEDRYKKALLQMEQNNIQISQNGTGKIGWGETTVAMGLEDIRNDLWSLLTSGGVFGGLNALMELDMGGKIMIYKGGKPNTSLGTKLASKYFGMDCPLGKLTKTTGTKYWGSKNPWVRTVARGASASLFGIFVGQLYDFIKAGLEASDPDIRIHYWDQDGGDEQ
jgi:hypothetical protein